MKKKGKKEKSISKPRRDSPTLDLPLCPALVAVVEKEMIKGTDPASLPEKDNHTKNGEPST
ncbi:MAG: hypothetical protein DRI93_05240 [Aquificota bacterium]|nr:MAG: hypothetical protein DRI93_05240 [Aquificota bacterium]RLD99496.1 MAG: hypothetical protein DRI91_00655 [Aquificota bacterium]